MKDKKIALIGNPNSGKTTIFNGLTDSSSKVGNWPGVTIEKKERKLTRQKSFSVVDLPGIYSLNAYSEDEKITKKFLLKKPDLIIDVIDTSTLKRNLYLTIQLLEMNQHLVIAFNMMDIAEKKYDKINFELFSQLLGTSVVPITGHKKRGIEELTQMIITATEKEYTEFRLPYGNELEDHLCILENLFKRKEVFIPGYTCRMLAIAALEGNKIIHKQLEPYAVLNTINKEIDHLQGIYHDDLESIFIEQRYGFIEGLIKRTVVKKRQIEKSLKFSDKVDKIVLHPLAGLLIFFGVTFLVFQIVFTMGDFIKNFLKMGFENLSIWISNTIHNDLAISFINNGIIGGVGTIITFLPNLILIFLLLTFLEDVGYMSRAAYLMDRFMCFFGLQGKAFIPLITGFGCSVPAILATRTLENKADRMTTIMIAPLISCSARLPIYLLFVSALFPAAQQGVVLFSIYILGIILAVIMAKIFKSTLFKAGNTTFVLELPPYRIPTAKATLIHSWERIKDFLSRAGTLILAMVIIIWVLSTLPLGVKYGSEQSIIGQIGTFIAPIFTPVGFGNYIASSTLIAGIVAKEVLVSTLCTVYGSTGDNLINTISNQWSALQAYAFMVMSAIYIPCLATLATIKKETGSFKWMFFAMGYTLMLGYIVSLIIYQGGLLLGLG